MPLSLQITNDDIDRVAGDFALDVSDEAWRRALRHVETVDIQAGPGCGKTTLLVAKLAIIASKWVWRDRGILVLSHTNVARHEIEKRALKHPTAHRILEYPHFVGTIQQFVDRFLALLYLRNIGWEVRSVDTERCVNAFRHLFWSGNSCPNAKIFVRPRQDHEKRKFVDGVRFVGPEPKVGWHVSIARLPGEATATYQEMSQLKRSLAQSGLHCFEDMYAFAQAYLQTTPELRAAFRHRFPWVFMDELQDTDATQDGVIRDLFGDECILQRLGDQNQAIFSDRGVDSGQTSLFRDHALDLPTSIRFGPSLATLATQLTVRHQRLAGNTQLHNGRHTIFLFGPNRIREVLSRFAELLLEEYPNGLPPSFVAKALGRVAKNPGPAHANRVPNCIGDYWADYDDTIAKSSNLPDTLVDCIRLARHRLITTLAGADPFRILLDAVVEVLRVHNFQASEGKTLTRMSFRYLLRESGEETQRAFWNWCRSACFTICTDDQAAWAIFAQEFRRVLELAAGVALDRIPGGFFQWKGPGELGGIRLEPVRSANIFLYPSNDPRVQIHVGTIHSAKGETHTATLILETFYYDHDMKQLIPHLIDQPGNRAPLNARKQEWMRCIFVGATRPRELLCLAVRSDHVNPDQRDQLATKGWNLVDI